ncbi:FeS cluster biolocus tagsis [Echinococcus multilocularis]|uniref:Iron-sulfur cluster assembly 1 homolog, mitochondrial n=1 Tax=Echinococcus multilocularis TaxID=6211 RepID=A0A087W1E6_ECHMU|nr:FeS cluster biolocus tagsis [Echinococcus multilocularis]
MFRWMGFVRSTLQALTEPRLPTRLLALYRRAGTISSSVRTTNNPRRLTKLPKGRFQAITLTDSALQRARELLSQQPDAIGLRIGVRARGCNGLSYTLAFCSEQQKGDEVVVQDGVSVFIDRKAQLTLLGSEMHFRKTLISSEFVFNNPNVKGTCGCGESFSI